MGSSSCAVSAAGGLLLYRAVHVLVQQRGQMYVAGQWPMWHFLLEASSACGPLLTAAQMILLHHGTAAPCHSSFQAALGASHGCSSRGHTAVATSMHVMRTEWHHVNKTSSACICAAGTMQRGDQSNP